MVSVKQNFQSYLFPKTARSDFLNSVPDLFILCNILISFVNFKRNISKMKTKLTYVESVQLWVSLVTCAKVNLSCGIAILHQHREIKTTSENI